MDSVIALEA